jgi:hypothetical protein
LLVAENLDVQQNLDEQNLDVIPPFLVVVHRFLVNLLDVVDVELLHQLKMDCFLDEVDVELLHQLKMDCFLDEVDVELLHQLKMDCFLDVVLAQMVLMLKQQVELHHFLQRAQQLHAWPLLPYLQPP